MNESPTSDSGKFAETMPCLHRLRRYPHNGITESITVMGGRMLNGGNRRTTYFVLSILLVSSLPMLTNVSAEDVGIPSDLQAQDIQVTFDNVSETTTVTWRNIAQAGGAKFYSSASSESPAEFETFSIIRLTASDGCAPWLIHF